MILSNNNRLQHWKQHAFTLVEVLSVAAILAVLAVVLIMAWQSVKNGGLAVKNIHQHRQIAGALIVYANDHGGNLPYCYDDSELPKMTYPRLLALGGYIGNPHVFFSPLADRWYEREGSSALENPSANAVVPWFYTNYAANRFGAMPYGENGGIKAKRKPANLNRVAGDGNLSKLMLLRDGYASSQQDRGGGTVWFDYADYLPPLSKTYGGIVHASFADGHVKGFRRDEIRQLLANSPDQTPPLFRKLYTRSP